MSESIFAAYENLWLLTRQMLNAAQNGDWDALIEGELKRNAWVERMRVQNASSVMNTVEQQKAGEIIRNVLAADKEIKTLTEAWKGELQEILGSIGTEKKLSKAYETP
ncbi:flagellar protein FliT [Sulfuricella sp.]|uniref:flagellar protein FliT n=1 Tax=Sulfuricella sp. TaxID=2099377 RepID=UPI002BB40733|nr:flagellar protein FliT [Sulfuricella sp.]HUX63631.1 flagellar protein FliT [Sulfuricella sp.]